MRSNPGSRRLPAHKHGQLIIIVILVVADGVVISMATWYTVKQVGLA
jgi:hypothetical protein